MIFRAFTSEELQIVKAMTREETDALKAEINTADPHLVFQAAGSSKNDNTRKIICPICGNGSGKDKTPVEANFKGGKWLYNCFRCNDFKGDLLAVIANSEHLDLNNRDDFCKALAIGATAIGYPLIPSSSKPTRVNYHKLEPLKNSTTAKKIAPKFSDEELKRKAAERKKEEQKREEIRTIINKAWQNLQPFIERQPNQKWRGLTLETLRHFNCGYLQNWKRSGGAKNFSERVIIPADNTKSGANYLARLVNKVTDYPENIRERINPKQHDGKKTLFNRDALAFNKDVDFCIVVEGYIDAMSIWQVFNGDIAVVALGGQGSGNLYLTAVQSLPYKPKTLILFDAGAEKTAENLRGDLIKIGVPAACKIYDDFLTTTDAEKIGEAVDANSILVKLGDQKLKSITEQIIKSSQDDFSAVEKEIADVRKEDNKTKSAQGDQCVADERPTDNTTQSPPKDNLPPDDLTPPPDDRPITDNDFFKIEDFIWGDTSNADNARRLKDFRGEVIRWLKDCEKWLIYNNGTWQKWSEKNSCLYPFAAEFGAFISPHIKRLYDNAKEIRQKAISTDDNGAVISHNQKMLDKAKDFQSMADKAHAIKMIFKERKEVNAAIDMLKGFKEILITTEDLNRHKNLFCVKNGVIDLETGKLYPLAPKFLITNQADVIFNPNMDAAFVEKFLADIMPIVETKQAVLRYLGYGLTGEKPYHVAHFWKGSGANGKSTLIDLLIKTFGNYAKKLPNNSMIQSLRPPDANAPSPAIAALDGDIRLAILDETPRNRKLDAALFKTITGDETITARNLHENLKKIELRAKLIISGNHLPTFDVDDDGVKRRIQRVEYREKFLSNRADPLLPKKLALPENRAAFFKILVAEAQEYYRSGILESEDMIETKAEYIKENDFVAEFFAEHVTFDAGTTLFRRVLEEKIREVYPVAKSFSKTELFNMILPHAQKLGAAYMQDRIKNNIFKNIRLVD